MSNMWELQSDNRITVGECYIFMVVNTCLLVMFAWYLARVQPGPYGQKLPCCFLFQKGYWRGRPAVGHEPAATPVSEEDQQYFEKVPPSLPIGIQVSNVYKSYGKEAVLHGVSLAVYHSEITVLLGHNGAGKTTLMNIITGLISPTSGHVLVEGKDTLLQAAQVRKLLGYCPQHNLFIAELTVLQHTRFFAMLKGKTCSQSHEAAMDLFSRLQLSTKVNSYASELSGGMQRRMQLACALVGGSRVLVLDEPTSGLDVETRRELWDLILSLRGDHTVLLTTHYMEEADALGDRIVALHHGLVKCHASPMFLKRAIGTGYRLTLTTVGPPKEAELTSTITRIIPDAATGDKKPNGVSYSLPAKDVSQFPALFSALESARGDLGIDTIGVGKSTLDEVFVKLCSDEDFAYLEEKEAKAAVEPTREKVTGVKLRCHQFSALLVRQCRFMLCDVIFRILIMVLIVLLLALFTWSNNNYDSTSDNSTNQTVSLDLDLYEAGARRALVSADTDTVKALRAGYGNARFEEVPGINDAALRTGKQDIQDYLMGIELNDTSAKVLYSPKRKHAAPVALNALSNALAARRLGAGRVLHARSHPLQDAYLPYNATGTKKTKSSDILNTWVGLIVLVSMLFLSTLLSLPVEERASGVRHALVLAGAPRALVWGATFITHLIIGLVICVVPTVIFAAVIEQDSTINQVGFLLVLFILMLMGSAAFLFYIYYASVACPRYVKTIVYISVIVYGFLTPLMGKNTYFKIPHIVLSVIKPPHTLAVAIGHVGQVAQLNAFCNLNRGRCPNMTGLGDYDLMCCDSDAGSEPWSYWGLDNAGSAIIYFCIQIVLYSVCTFFADMGVFEYLWLSILARCCSIVAPAQRFEDAPSRAEAEYVGNTIKLPKNEIPDAVLVHNVKKFYKDCMCKKAFFAVNGLSFSVKKGECFGLLGVNGAGKSTMFSMLTAQRRPTSGQIFANGYNSRETRYMRTFSYCPQFGGVDRFLTGRQNLALMLTMRGLQSEDVAAIAAYWLKEVDLSKDADKRVSAYSGGMARRAAAAAALCQSSRTTVLDEPTAGVDPVARRRMHVALMRAKRHRSIIIASHSLEEIESLCHRIAIMSGGELRALGTAAALKTQYGSGYSVVFKLVVPKDEGTEMVEEFKRQIHARFDCELRDEHLGTLSYHLKDSMRYSALFTQLEQLRTQFPTLLEDYTVTETTLEEVFLMLAKEARQEPAPTGGAAGPPPKPAEPAKTTQATA